MGVYQPFEFLSSCDNLIPVPSRFDQFSALLRSRFAEQTWPCESWGRPGRLGHPKETPQWGSLSHLRDRDRLKLGQARPSTHGWGQAQTRPMAGQGGVRQGPWCSPRLAKVGPWAVAWLGSTLTKLWKLIKCIKLLNCVNILCLNHISSFQIQILISETRKFLK